MSLFIMARHQVHFAATHLLLFEPGSCIGYQQCAGVVVWITWPPASLVLDPATGTNTTGTSCIAYSYIVYLGDAAVRKHWTSCSVINTVLDASQGQEPQHAAVTWPAAGCSPVWVQETEALRHPCSKPDCFTPDRCDNTKYNLRLCRHQ